MKVLHISAQKPDSTGSGVYMSEVIESLARVNASQAVIVGIGAQDQVKFPEGVLVRPVRYEGRDLDFPVLGMSDGMPYPAMRYRDLTPAMVADFKAAFTQAVNDVFDEFVPDVIICHHLYLMCATVVRAVDVWAQAHPDQPRPIVAGLCHSTDIRQFTSHDLEHDFIAGGMRDLDYALALHEAQAAEIIEVYGIDPNRVKVVGTGYSPRDFHVIEGMRNPDERNMVFVGKIWSSKGVPYLIEALDKMPEEVLPTKVTLVGGYNSKEEYDQLVERANRCRVPIVFAGKVPLAELVSLYNTGHTFVLPSLYEGLPLVLIEALACGCNLVTTDLPGIRPWLDAYVPQANVEYVTPPRMIDPMTADPDDIPGFEDELAIALERSLKTPLKCVDTQALSWDALGTRIIEAVGV